MRVERPYIVRTIWGQAKLVEPYLIWVIRCLAFAHFISSLEMLKCRWLLREGELVSWSLIRAKMPVYLSPPLDKFFLSSRSEIVPWLRLAASIWLLLRNDSLVALGILLLTTLIHQLRTCPIIPDTGDEFLLLVTATSFLQALPSFSLFGSPQYLQKAAFIFIIAQAVLSYFTAGCFKIRGGWGDGKFMLDLADCRLMVDQKHGDFFKRNKWLLKPMEIQVVFMQIAAPGVFFLGPQFCYFFAAWSFIFHLLGSIGLGLRTFSHAYLALYPALIWWASTH